MIEVGSQRAYDVQEVAKLLNLTAQTVRSYIKSGKFKAQKVGQRYFITEQCLQDFLRGDNRDNGRFEEKL